jgi:hypothetical protein
MIFRTIAEATMVVHFLVLAYMTLGGFLAWRWPRMIWPHLGICAWALASLAGVDCPLTILEDWARRMAGERALPPSGFIDYYIEGVVYPQRYTDLVRVAVALVVLVSWAGFARIRLSRAARTSSPHRTGT